MKWNTCPDIPWLDEMCGCENGTEDNAETANDDVGDAQEVVAATHNGTGGDEDGLLALVYFGREICGY